MKSNAKSKYKKKLEKKTHFYSDIITRHNPKKVEIKKQHLIINQTKKLKEKTQIIPAIKESLALVKQKNEKSREKKPKNTENIIGKIGKSAEKKGKKKKSIKKLTKNLLLVLGLGGSQDVFSGEEKEKISDKTAELLSDDAKLKVINDSAADLEKLKKDNKLIYDLDNINSEKKSKLEKKINKYRAKNFGLRQILGETWTSTKFNKKREKNGVIKRLFLSFTRFFTNFTFYLSVKRGEKVGVFEKYKNLKEKEKEGKKVAKELQEEGRKVGKKVEVAKEINRLSKTSGLVAARRIVKDYKEKMAKISALPVKKRAIHAQKSLITLYKDVKKITAK